MDSTRQMMHSFWQGIVRVFILHQASQSPVYGGKLKKQFQEWGYDIGAGRLYPLLHTFEKDRLLSSRVKIFQGRARKYYDITDRGRAVLAEVQQELKGIMAKIMSADREAFDQSPPREHSHG